MSIEINPAPGTMQEMPLRIGKYEVRSLLGEGGTSIVYEAFDPDIQRRVAIKVLRSHLLGGKVGAELLARFKREAISAARCVHPNIVSILEYGQDGNRPFIVMEYIDGISVHRLIKHRLKYGRGISLRRSLSIISQLLKALHAAHELNIIHRDVKASNVMIVNRRGGIKLADFGMARTMESPDLTMIGSMIGTPRYMAPEIRFGLEADSRADVFSAARLFLELLRLLPASSPVPRSSLPEIANMPPGNRIDYSVVYPTALIPVLTRALAVDRDERYQTVLEFMLAIKRALPGLNRKTLNAVPGFLQKAALASSDLRPKTAPTPGQAAPVAGSSVSNLPPSEDEVDSMRLLLADFVGPIATLIMEEHETRSTSANNLAVEISKEIPEREQREEFLERWQMMSLSRQAAISEQRSHVAADGTGEKIPKSELLNRIGHDLAHYIGPIANKLFNHYSARTNDVNQLVKILGREIPDRKQGQKFVKSWLRD